MQTKKVDLRKVKISKYEDGSGSHDTNAFFHEWGLFPYHAESGTFQVTYAIVELEESGDIKNYESNRLKFVDAF
jgi:hypothetical protein